MSLLWTGGIVIGELSTKGYNDGAQALIITGAILDGLLLLGSLGQWIFSEDEEKKNQKWCQTLFVHHVTLMGSICARTCYWDRDELDDDAHCDGGRRGGYLGPAFDLPYCRRSLGGVSRFDRRWQCGFE